MRHAFPALRRVAVVTVAVLSIIWGAFLIWGLAGREQIGLLTNAYLLGIVSLLLLPGAALVAWELDRRACARLAGESEDVNVHIHTAADDREPEAGHRHRVRENDRVMG